MAKANCSFAYNIDFFLWQAAFFYAFKIEPYRIKVNEHTMNEKRKDINNLKIVQISDIHIKDDFTYKNLGK